MKIINRTSISIIVLLALLLFSCDIKDNKEVKPETYVKIYNNENFSESYIPYDIQQTSDGGFIILGARRINTSPFFGVYLMKVDKEGQFVTHQELSTDFVNPVKELIAIGNEFYFFCMNSLTLNSILMSVNESGEVRTISESSVIYPLAACKDNQQGLALLSYNRDDLKTVFTRFTIAGDITDQRSYDIGFGDFDIEEPVIDHLTGTGKHLPFFCGSIDNNRFFINGFYNYTLSTLIIDFSKDEKAMPAVLQGYRDERCLSSMTFISGNTFALSRYAYGKNFISPVTAINTNGGAISSSNDIQGNIILELPDNAKMIARKLEINGRSCIVFGSETKSKQILLLFYDATSGQLIATKNLGYTNPYEMAGFTGTSDGGMAVTGTTYIAGRFARVCLFKLSAEDLKI
ncbi:MAG TPA: hypothetical protein VIK89_07785 [Cytophagaceae bacterium]